MKSLRSITLESSTKVVIQEMFLEEGEINPAYPIFVV